MKTVVFLMGPTASGKTDLAVEWVRRGACEIVSVDSGMVYKGLDIGSAKPGAETLRVAPHRLIDVCDPGVAYSAGEFRRDALRAEWEGWDSMHACLAEFDPVAAERIHAHDGQRIQRAIEVYRLTGKTITAWQNEDTSPLADYQVLAYGLMPEDRGALHERIAARFRKMMADGLVEEVRGLYERGDLHADLPAIRSVGYRQVWAHLAGQISMSEMEEKAITATRQLAKRQMTWLRSWPGIKLIDSTFCFSSLFAGGRNKKVEAG